MKKLLIFLMIAIPLVIIVVLNFTVSTVTGLVPVAVDSICLNSESTTGLVGGSFALNASFTPENASNKSITWKSDNESVATVDKNGVVSFVGYGKCYITATTEDGNKKASCYFYIYDTVAHDLDFYSPKETIVVGETLGLQATILPVEAENKEIEFKSYDESIATIDQNGYLYAKNPGYVTLSATATEANLTKFLSILVVRPITSFSVLEEDVVVSDLDYQIKVKTFPQNATQTELIYTSSDPSIATISKKGYVTFSRAGKVDVTIEDQNKTMSKTISIRSTAGFVHDIFVSDSIINTTLSDAARLIDISVSPSNITLNNLEIKSDNSEICEVDENNYLQVFSTGSTTIRIRAQKSEDTWIEKTILVNVTHPAEGIVLDDVIYVSGNSTRLEPVAFPLISTNKDFFFHSKDESVATVSEDGIVSKIGDGVCEVEIEVYANFDLSDVSKTIKIVFTNGLAQKAEILQKQVELNVGQSYALEPKFSPVGSTAKSIDMRVVSQVQNVEGLEVVDFQNGEIVAMHGGQAKIEVAITLFDDSTVSCEVDVVVTSLVSQIDYVVDLDKQDDVFVTGQPTLTFDFSVLPSDATNKQIEWTIESGPAMIVANSIKFSSKGTAYVVGKSEDGACEVKFKVKYVGPNPLSATLSEIPQSIMVGDTFEVQLLETFPQNAMFKNVSYQISNHVTSSLSSSKVLDVVDGKLKALAGGTCVLCVNVSSSCQYVFDIVVTRLPESIVVYPSGIQTTKSSLSLTANVLPYDTSNTKVLYEVVESEIAQIQNGILTFKQNGIINIIARCEADESVSYSFQIEKIDKSTTTISPTSKNISMQIGEKSILDLTTFCENYDSYSIEIADENILKISDLVISAIDYGDTCVDIYFFDKAGVIVQFDKINVCVVKLVQSFEILEELDYVSGEFQTANALVELTSSVLPNDATNPKINFEISESFSSSGEKLNNIAYIDGEQMHFLQSGIVVLRATSDDASGISKLYRVRYTGGNATNVELSFEQIVMEIGQVVEISVSKWIPKNTTNKQIFVESLTSDDVVEISGQKIVAKKGGSARIRVELSSGITKIVSVIINKKVQEINVESDNILTSKQQYAILATVSPEDATDKTLIYEMVQNDIAKLEENVLTFLKAGTVEVDIYSKDGSVTKNVLVTSTFGALSNFELNTLDVKILKGSQQTLLVSKFYPSDFDFDRTKLKYEIVENNPQNSQENVVVLDGAKLKANYGGTAKVRVYFENEDQSVVEQYVSVEVVQILQSIEVSFSRDVDEMYGTKVVGLDKIGFSVCPYPLDAYITKLQYISSDEEIAKVTDGEINFLKGGKVDIKIEAYDGFDNVSTKTISFYYTDGKIIDAKIDTTGFVGSTRKMAAGESFEIKLISYIPKDVEINQIVMIEKVEKKNYESLSVLKFENQTIFAMAGGEATFKFDICSFVTGVYKIEVTQKASQISTETSLYVSSPECKIEYSVLPLDASSKDVVFWTESSIAEVDGYGNVTFKKYGTAFIVVALKDDDQISRTIKIEYSNNVRVIMFKNTPESLFVRSSVQLGIDYLPYGADEFSVAYSVSDTTLATVNSSGKLFTNNEAGEIVVRAYVVENPEIYAEIKIKIKIVISDIELELDAADDVCGIGGYRVFGNAFLNFGENALEISNQYQMNIKSIKPYVETDLVWTSSNKDVATVDENGVVTFVGAAGEVTITVQPLDQISSNEELFCKDSYTFSVVHGINVYDKSQLECVLFNDALNEPIVIQKDIVYNLWNGIATQQSFYGNGHIIDLSYPDYNESGAARTYNRFSVRSSNVVIDNLQIRGTTFDENSSLSSLEGKGCAFIVETPIGESEKVQNVMVRNCILENGVFAARAYGAQVTFAGCIIRNSYSGGLTISVNDNGVPSDVTVKDCIFKGSYLSSILFDLKKAGEDGSNSDNILRLEGDVKIINWIDIEEINGNSIAAEVGDASSQLREIIKQKTELTKYYNGKYYFMAGITAFKAGYDGILTYESVLNVDATKMSSTYRYTPYKIAGMVKVYGVPVAFEMTGYSLASSETEILPDSKIEDDPLAFEKIRQPR